MENKTKGFNVRNSLSSNPEIASALILYEQCRSLQIIQTEHSSGGGKNARRSTKITTFPMGYSVLPYEGGLLDQPLRIWTYFEIFFSVEREIAFRNLSGK